MLLSNCFLLIDSRLPSLCRYYVLRWQAYSLSVTKWQPETTHPNWNHRCGRTNIMQNTNISKNNWVLNYHLDVQNKNYWQVSLSIYHYTECEVFLQRGTLKNSPKCQHHQSLGTTSDPVHVSHTVRSRNINRAMQYVIIKYLWRFLVYWQC